jgi:hypothetical protein
MAKRPTLNEPEKVAHLATRPTTFWIAIQSQPVAESRHRHGNGTATPFAPSVAPLVSPLRTPVCSLSVPRCAVAARPVGERNRFQANAAAGE